MGCGDGYVFNRYIIFSVQQCLSVHIVLVFLKIFNSSGYKIDLRVNALNQYRTTGSTVKYRFSRTC